MMTLKEKDKEWAGRIGKFVVDAMSKLKDLSEAKDRLPLLLTWTKRWMRWLKKSKA